MTMTFHKEIAEALGNPDLAGALGRFYEAYPASRAKAYQGVDFEAVRGRIAGIKGDAAGRLPELAARFTREAEARGAKVVLLRSPEEVRRYIVDLAREKGVKKVAKSKSMASEEVHLNAALLEAGVHVALVRSLLFLQNAQEFSRDGQRIDHGILGHFVLSSVAACAAAISSFKSWARLSSTGRRTRSLRIM